MSACAKPAGGMVMDMGMGMPPMPDGMSTGDVQGSSAFTLRAPEGTFSCHTDIALSDEGGKIDKWLCDFQPSDEPLCPDMNLLVDTNEAFFHCVQNGPRVECRVPAGMRVDQASASPASIQCGLPTLPMPMPSLYSPPAAPAIVLTSSSGHEYSCTNSLGGGDWECSFSGPQPTVSCDIGPTYAVFGSGDFCAHQKDGRVVCSFLSPSPQSHSVGDVVFMC